MKVTMLLKNQKSLEANLDKLSTENEDLQKQVRLIAQL
jgi:cell division protein FtsB